MVQSGIYCWTSPSGKKYVGQAGNLHRRKLDFLNFNQPYAGRAITNARNKYNHKEDWEYNILEYCVKDVLNEREIYWIGILDTFNNGYNCDEGGKGVSGYKFTEEQKKHLSDVHKGISPSNKGVPCSEETKKRISESRKGISAWNKGLKLGYGARSKSISLFYKDGTFIRSYEYIRQGSEDTGVNESHILEVCQGKRKTAGGFIWRYTEGED